MKLASLKSFRRDGELIVVNRDLTKGVSVPDIATTLQGALDQWDAVHTDLEWLYKGLNSGKIQGFDLDFSQLAAPLPRALQWLDGSAYLSHVQRVRKARGAEMPASFLHNPLMYQGAADNLLGCRDPISVAELAWGVDFEAEIGVITGDVPLGVSLEDASSHILLLTLINDVSFRNLIPDELAKGFGFVHGKPSSAFSPVFVTPDELGEHWHDAKIHLPLQVYWNEEQFGQAQAGQDMQFNFSQLISHAAKTRMLSAGTIIGSGTVSNVDDSVGYSCIVEKRVVEISATGKAQTNYMNYGDSIRIEMLDQQGRSVFGAIEQQIKA